jgi:hypothetical protein
MNWLVADSVADTSTNRFIFGIVMVLGEMGGTSAAGRTAECEASYTGRC